MDKEAWRTARKKADEIKAKMDELMADLMEELARMDEIEDSPDFDGCCDGCGEPMTFDDPYIRRGFKCLCAACSPSFANLLAHPDQFYDDRGGPMTPDKAREIVDAHVAGGGSITDKMVR